MKNILVIEDFQPIAKAIKALLEAAGHQVTWLVGANSYQATEGGVTIVGLTANDQTVEVDCRQFQVAFVDGQLEGKIEGPALVKLLAQSNVACCGMSSQTAMNDEMIALGATLAAKKPVIFAGLLSAKLSVAAVLTPTRSTLARLANMEKRFTLPEFQDLRHEADALLMSYMTETE